MSLPQAERIHYRAKAIPRPVDAILRPVRAPYRRIREQGGKILFSGGADLGTDGLIPLERFGLADPERSYYQPAPWSTLPRILPRREVSEQDVFIDYGCGMGRIVYLAAARYRFKRVIGLEISAQLNEIAQANIERNADRLRCQDVELVTADALDYQPPNDTTVAFFANPFRGRVFAAALLRLLDSVSGPLRIIYFNPVEHAMVMDTGQFRVVRRLRGWRPGHEWSRSRTTVMYERCAC
jgi:SAM-dependent methyltransferase